MAARRLGGIGAIVPMKGFRDAKSRLGLLLDCSQRALLAEAMARDVLDVLLRVAGLATVAVVTSDGAVAALARSYGVAVVDDCTDTGTNDAVRQGLHWLSGSGYAGALVVPGDVPFLGCDEVEAMLVAMRRNIVAVVPARRDGGTNMLGLSPPDVISPCFGSNSFAGHLAAARMAGIEPAVLRLDGAGHDIDVPSDLWVQRSYAAPHTRRRLADFGFFDTPVAAGILQEALSP